MTRAEGMLDNSFIILSGTAYCNMGVWPQIYPDVGRYRGCIEGDTEAMSLASMRK